ncbi:GTP-binding protein HflX [Neorhodopirellula lusitana]|uniref:GTPase HflX n=1 Tax=Neorhodopirellula lusitana TaxID=445327 RepID=A0ABY1QLE3_9BACT|nr:GTPase HflX [Neorhodopirellula lusitana]SMP72627.1 GTP-binding protein HflX [Neorhodopirellula lusitana]
MISLHDDGPERSILARLILPKSTVEDDPLEELHGLAATAGTQVVDELTQKRGTPDHSTYLGKGKVEELRLMVEKYEADVIFFDNDLNPAQVRNLETATKAKVIDRTELILDIFAAGARTHESRLAVELAQLEYSLPRLKRMWTHLSRQSMGVGMRGPGEKQLEVDRRLAQKRIHDLKEELSRVESRRERQVAARNDVPTISLVGYTNAGKSTLMNALTEAGVLAQDKLFATLETRTRRWHLPNWGHVLISDTVGFIRDLPHSLVASFKSTLEETRQADLLMHVADASSPNVFEQITAVYKVLEELGVRAKDTLLVLNKIDAIENPQLLNRVLDRYPHAIPVSAKSKKGLQALQEIVGEALSRGFLDVEVDVAHHDGKLLSYLSAKGKIESRDFGDSHVTVRVRMPAGAMGVVHQTALRVAPTKLSLQNTVPTADVAETQEVPDVGDEPTDVSSTSSEVA